MSNYEFSPEYHTGFPDEMQRFVHGEEKRALSATDGNPFCGFILQLARIAKAANHLCENVDEGDGLDDFVQVSRADIDRLIKLLDDARIQ